MQSSKAPARGNQPEGVLDWSGRFFDPELEDGYRSHQLQSDRHVLRFAGSLCAFSVTFFAVSDYHFLGTAWPFALLLTLRIVLVVLTIYLVASLSRATRWQHIDRIVFIQLIALASLQVIAAWTRPADFVGWFVKDICGTMIIFCLVPVPLKTQIPPTLMLIAGDCVVGAVVPSVSSMPGLGFVAIVSGCLAYVFGFFTSLQMNRQKRQLYYASVVQTTLTARLELALQEIRTLRGIVPICAHCKMIRDTANKWHPIEEYIRQNSHAEFSHGVCPACLEAHYGDFTAEEAG